MVEILDPGVTRQFAYVNMDESEIISDLKSLSRNRLPRNFNTMY